MKKKFKKEFVDLTEEQIKNIRRNREDLDMNVINTKLAIDQMRVQIANDMPMRGARSQLRQMEDQLELNQKNLKVLDKQLREKRIKYTIPVQ